MSTQTVSQSDRPGIAGRTIGVRTADILKVNARLMRGLPYSALERLRKASGLSREQIGRVAQIPRRTLARRKSSGMLTAAESERLFRLAVVFEKALDLFEDDADAARQWLTSPARAFAGATPLEMTESELGAREVEGLIGRLEHGVFA